MIMMIDWWDLPSLTTLIGNGRNFSMINKVILKGGDWWLNLN